MKPIQLPPRTLEQLQAVYRKTRDVRLRNRVQTILLAFEKGLVAQAICEIVRLSD